MKRESCVFIHWDSPYGDYGNDHVMLDSLLPPFFKISNICLKQCQMLFYKE